MEKLTDYNPFQLYNFMIPFNEWLKIIAEESKEEREAREIESKRRAELDDEYFAKKKTHFYLSPKAPIGSPEWMKHARKSPQNPLDQFQQDVDEEILKITGLDWRYGEIIDSSVGEKEYTDERRILKLIIDSWEDGSTPQETARMAVELMKSMGYLK